MSSNLHIAILRCRAVLQVHSFEDGVLSKFLFDGQHGFLHLLFTLKFGLLLSLFCLKSCVVREEVKLLKTTILLWCVRFWQNMIYRDIEPSDEKVLSTIRSNNSDTAHIIFFVDDVWQSRFIVP